MFRRRLASLALALAVICSTGLSILASSVELSASPAKPGTSGLLRLPQAHQDSSSQSEIDDLIVAPISMSMSASEVMRSRPFILDWNTNPAFAIHETPPEPLTRDGSRAELRRLLELRGASESTSMEALRLFDDQGVAQIIPDPSLRTALLLLYGLDPYQTVVDSILEGANDTGLPFGAVEFANLNFEGAVASITLDPYSPNARYRLQISSVFASEPPIHLAPVIIHESLHGDGFNSTEEELTANILDTIAYGELLLIDPSSALAGTELTAYNNIQLYALLNSIGANGGGHVGISTSVSGDVFVGPGLEDFDAGSVRDSILQDEFYGSLSSGGSSIPLTTTELIERFPGHDAIGDEPSYGEALLTLVDRGATYVLTPENARDLSLILGLEVTIGSLEAHAAVLQANPLALQDRPFIPIQPALFDLNQSRRAQSISSEAVMRELLAASLDKQSASPARFSQLLGLYDDPAVSAQIPDSQLRAAVILIASLEPWSETLQSVLAAPGQMTEWRFSFEPLPIPVNALYDSSHDGQKIVHLNHLLIGDSLEVTAAAVLEGVLLEEDRRSPNGAVVAALMSTLAYGDLVSFNPEVVLIRTWGTISRNTDLLSLVNSAQWSAGSSTSAANTIGFMAPANGTNDVLPGLIRDASSFQSHVLGSARLNGTENMSISIASELLVRLVGISGVPIVSGPGGPVINEATLFLLDASVGDFMTAPDIQSLAEVLFLGVAA